MELDELPPLSESYIQAVVGRHDEGLTLCKSSQLAASTWPVALLELYIRMSNTQTPSHQVHKYLRWSSPVSLHRGSTPVVGSQRLLHDANPADRPPLDTSVAANP